MVVGAFKVGLAPQRRRHLHVALEQDGPRRVSNFSLPVRCIACHLLNAHVVLGVADALAVKLERVPPVTL
eukprot:123168-Prymnesium_polylepis.2